MEYIIKSRFKLFNQELFDFTSINTVKAFMLLAKDKCHPLIDKILLNKLNTDKVEYGVIFYSFNGKECHLNTPYGLPPQKCYG